MARINFPGSIKGWFDLFKIVKPKVLALATPNLVDSYLTENNIVLADDETAMNASETAHDLGAEKERDGETKNEEGKQLNNAVKKNHRIFAQGLKAVFRPTPHKLGDWGITVNNESELVYKTEAAEHAVEMQLLVTKHNTFPVNTSPLQGLLNAQGINIVQHGANVAASIAAFAAADANHGQSETQNELRNNLLFPVIEHLRGMAQAAVKMYATNPHKAGDLGFTIDASKRPPVLRTFTLGPDADMDLVKVDNGSFFTVTGVGEILITPKGAREAARGSRAIANQFQKALVTHGFGSCNVKNTSSTSEVTFTVEIHQ